MLYAPRCEGPVSLRRPLHLETIRALRRATERPIKVSYTGIHVLALFTDDHYYRDYRPLALALADAFRADFAALASEGVDVIQLDEFVWAEGVTQWEGRGPQPRRQRHRLSVLGARMLEAFNPAPAAARGE